MFHPMHMDDAATNPTIDPSLAHQYPNVHPSPDLSYYWQ
jgi:hypothetical protein